MSKRVVLYPLGYLKEKYGFKDGEDWHLKDTVSITKGMQRDWIDGEVVEIDLYRDNTYRVLTENLIGYSIADWMIAGPYIPWGTEIEVRDSKKDLWTLVEFDGYIFSDLKRCSGEFKVRAVGGIYWKYFRLIKKPKTRPMTLPEIMDVMADPRVIVAMIDESRECGICWDWGPLAHEVSLKPKEYFYIRIPDNFDGDFTELKRCRFEKDAGGGSE